MFATDLESGYLQALGALSDPHLTPEEANEVFRVRMRSKVLSYVAMADGKIVGTASLFIEPKFIHSGGKVGHIEDVAVDPTLQGLGIGAKLVQYLIGKCRDAGCYKVILDCDPKNVPFYEKMGFRNWCQAMRIDL